MTETDFRNLLEEEELELEIPGVTDYLIEKAVERKLFQKDEYKSLEVLKNFADAIYDEIVTETEKLEVISASLDNIIEKIMNLSDEQWNILMNNDVNKSIEEKNIITLEDNILNTNGKFIDCKIEPVCEVEETKKNIIVNVYLNNKTSTTSFKY